MNRIHWQVFMQHIQRYPPHSKKKTKILRNKKRSATVAVSNKLDGRRD